MNAFCCLKTTPQLDTSKKTKNVRKSELDLLTQQKQMALESSGLELGLSFSELNGTDISR
jgi:hypothetical protein